ncbi:MAG: hypothetical protein GX568_01855 [Candidatus Gastranaerophilales bacterium]|nr:hypothetical protein [Candidatus Gastranaerophilales bacterium]
MADFKVNQEVVANLKNNYQARKFHKPEGLINGVVSAIAQTLEVDDSYYEHGKTPAKIVVQQTNDGKYIFDGNLLTVEKNDGSIYLTDKFASSRASEESVQLKGKNFEADLCNSTLNVQNSTGKITAYSTQKDDQMDIWARKNSKLDITSEGNVGGKIKVVRSGGSEISLKDHSENTPGKSAFTRFFGNLLDKGSGKLTVDTENPNTTVRFKDHDGAKKHIIKAEGENNFTLDM